MPMLMATASTPKSAAMAGSEVAMIVPSSSCMKTTSATRRRHEAMHRGRGLAGRWDGHGPREAVAMSGKGKAGRMRPSPCGLGTRQLVRA